MSRLLAEYEELNSDLPKQTRRQLAIFVLATRCSKAVLEELFGMPLGSTPRRHRSWLYYNAMRFSNLGDYWDHFAHLKNSGHSMQVCLKDLRDIASRDDWETFSNRLGCAIFKDRKRLNPTHWTTPGSQKDIWTRGGVWSRAHGFTRIIILGDHLERNYDYNIISRNLGPHGAQLLERELHHTIDQEALLFSEAISRATEYARERIPTLASVYTEKRSSYHTASWFFGERVPTGPGRLVDYEWEHIRGTSIRANTYDWFPIEDDYARAQKEARE